MTKPSRSDVFDVALGVGVALGLAVITRRVDASERSDHLLDGIGYGCAAVAGLSLSLRRRAPEAGLLAAGAAVGLYSARNYPGGPVFVTPLVGAYFLAGSRPRRRTIPFVVVATSGVLVSGLVGGTGGGSGWIPLMYLGWMAAAVLLGEAARGRRAHFAAVEERHRHLEATREQEARRRVAEERLRIARDVHDVVAHTLSAIALQAGVGARLASSDPARESLAAIRHASKDGLRELRGALDVLRTGEGSPPRHPTPGLADLQHLVRELARAGVKVTTVISGSPRQLPATVETAVYRIVQEALTNVVRHAGTATATVAITYGDGGLEVEVLDDGCGRRVAADSDGYGIDGMRERAVAAGGRFEAGRGIRGGFRVWAQLPNGHDR